MRPKLGTVLPPGVGSDTGQQGEAATVEQSSKHSGTRNGPMQLAQSPPLGQQALPLLLQNKVTEDPSLQSLSFSSPPLNPVFLSSIASGCWCPLPCSFASSVCVQGAAGVGAGLSTIQDVGASLVLALISCAVSWHYRLVIATT